MDILSIEFGASIVLKDGRILSITNQGRAVFKVMFRNGEVLIKSIEKHESKVRINLIDDSHIDIDYQGERPAFITYQGQKSRI